LEESLQKLSNKGFDTDTSLKNSLIVDVEIDDYDNFIQELKATGSEEAHEMSQNDVERMYNLLCFQILAKQTDENKKYAPEKSYGRLKTALNVWFEKFYQCRGEWYRVIVKDLMKLKHGNSVLAKVIDEALEQYRPVQELEVGKREENKKQVITIEIPPEELSYTDLFEAMEVQKSAMLPFYLEKNYPGKDNESAFIAFLENNESVIWWHKNGDNGNEFFAIPYFDKNQQKERLFYPDWIIKTAEKIWIIDTKGGLTTNDAIHNGKAAALLHWLSDKPGFDGGIVEREAGIWKIHRSRVQEKNFDTQIVCEERAPYFYKGNLEL